MPLLPLLHLPRQPRAYQRLQVLPKRSRLNETMFKQNSTLPLPYRILDKEIMRKRLKHS